MKYYFTANAKYGRIAVSCHANHHDLIIEAILESGSVPTAITEEEFNKIKFNSIRQPEEYLVLTFFPSMQLDRIKEAMSLK